MALVEPDTVGLMASLHRNGIALRVRRPAATSNNHGTANRELIFNSCRVRAFTRAVAQMLRPLTIAQTGSKARAWTVVECRQTHQTFLQKIEPAVTMLQRRNVVAPRGIVWQSASLKTGKFRAIRQRFHPLIAHFMAPNRLCFDVSPEQTLQSVRGEHSMRAAA